jgi:hypothetical protein
MADIFSKIMIPVLFKADAQEDFTSPQYMIPVSRTGAWENLLREAAKKTVIKQEEIQE